MTSPNLPAVVPGAASAVRPMETFATDFGLEVWTSLPATARAELIGYLQGAAGSAADLLGETFDVEHIVAHRVELLNEDTGEVETADRIVLVMPGGEAVAAVSTGIRKSVALLVAMYGTPPWSPPLTVKLTQVSTRKGRRMFILTPTTKTAKGK